MANAAYRTSSFGDLHFGTRTNSTIAPGVTGAANEGLIALHYRSNSAIAVTPPTDWVEYGTNWNLSGSDRIHLYTKVGGGSEPANYTWTHNSVGTYGIIYIVQNVNTAGFIDFAAVGTTSGGQDPSASGTTTENNVLLVSHFTYVSNAGTVTEPSGFTEVGDRVNTFGVAHLLQASAGGTGAITWDTTVNDTTITILIGVKSEAAPSAGHPTMRRWGGVPGMVNGPRVGRGW